MSSAFFPPTGPSEAMSNWITKPEKVFNNLRWSDQAFLRKIAALDSAIKCVVIPILALVGATLDCFYHAVWLSVKAIVLLTRQGIQSVNPELSREFATGITRQDLKWHFTKCTQFFLAIFIAPPLGIFASDRLIESYRAKQMILP